MSTPRTLDLPDGVQATKIDTERGTFAALAVRGGRAGHVLLVPGWTGSKEDFTPVLPLLAAAGFEATAYDQRGQYETPGADDDDYSLGGYAADALAVARAITPTSHLLGHSFGGLVAQRAAVDAVTAWRTLSLLCTGPGTLGQGPQKPLDRLVEALESGVPMARIVQDLKGEALESEPDDVEAFVQDKFARTSRVSLAAMTRHLIESPDLTDRVATTGIDCWVGRGVDDAAWPHDRQDDQAHRLRTTTVVVPSSAHSPAIENPEGLAAAWLPFLQEVR